MQSEEQFQNPTSLNHEFNATANPMNDGPQFQVDPYAEQQINQGIASGFGQFFFNANDPNVAKTNVPVKLDSEMHLAILVSTFLLIGSIIGGVIMLDYPQAEIPGIAMMVVLYIVYLCVSLWCSEIHGYITNLKKFDDYKKTYDTMVQGRGYFRFWIECYHYKTVRTKNGTRRQKVVTHTATQNQYPTLSVDQSGNVTGIQDISKYVFIKYLKRFYFSDQSSESKLEAAYRNFVVRNTRDQYQSHTKTYDIEGFEQEVGFCMLGDSPHNCVIFYLMTFLGLALPYSCILERAVSRYSLIILKRLTY